MHVILLSAVIALFGMDPVLGHGGDRVYPFYEIPDENAIDVTDGTIEDWEELFGEPSLTSLDFTGFDSYFLSGESMGYNPSDLDFRIYLGWNGASDRIYIGAICIDDRYIGEEERSFKYLERQGEDSVTLMIDGDHDGFPQWDEVNLDEGDDSGKYGQAAQVYSGVPVRREASNVGIPFFETFFEGESWWGYPPYGNGGGSVAGENPVVWVTEFYVTPFDMLIRKEPENSLVSDLGAEQIVGFRVSIGDFDEPAISGPGGNRAGKLHVLGSYYGGTLRDVIGDTDTWMDGILLSANGIDSGGGTAVAPDSWARIKASFSQ